MSADLSSAAVYTDFQGLAKLRAEAGKESPEAIREVARQFEALFVQMMMKSMRDAVPRDDGLIDNRQVQFFEGLYDQQISLSISQERGIGLADVIYRQLGGKDDLEAIQDETTPVQNGEGMRLPEGRVPSIHVQKVLAAMEALSRVADVSTSPASVAEAAVASHESPWDVGSPEAYVRSVWPHAERAASKLGVDPEVLVAQSALETGWGRHIMRHPDGRSSHNLFGIKADRHWQGERVIVSSLEYVEGVAERQYAAFRAYPDPGQSFDDYVDFITRNPRYRDALANAGSAEGYLRGIQRAGYATDPAYANKILSILQQGPLNEFKAGLKSNESPPIT